MLGSVAGAAGNACGLNPGLSNGTRPLPYTPYPHCTLLTAQHSLTLTLHIDTSNSHLVAVIQGLLTAEPAGFNPDEKHYITTFVMYST